MNHPLRSLIPATQHAHPLPLQPKRLVGEHPAVHLQLLRRADEGRLPRGAQGHGSLLL